MASVPAIVFSGIAPHPPIMVPEVGHEAIVDVQSSIAAMAEFTLRLVASGAETVVLISPHAPLDPSAFVAYQTRDLYGDFANFRAPETTVEAQLDEELLTTIAREAVKQSYQVVSLRSDQLDHGTAVPLYFLQHNGWQGRVVAFGYSFLSNEDHLRFGACISRAAAEVGRPIAIVASGDLSHRLKPDAPAGYHPTAHLFDQEVVAAFRDNSPARIINMDEGLRRIAGECGYRSLLVALGATKDLPSSCEVLNYEAPFGVGYLVAQLTNQKSTSRNAEPQTRSAGNDEGLELPKLARETIETFVLTGSPPKTLGEASGLLAERAACFVSIKTKDGRLRGCIGTIEPTQDTLQEEVIANALGAATRDPRFKPVTANELPQLRYSVDVLAAPEPTTFAELDAKTYGVIVEDENEDRRGLLLPDIEGVDTTSKQVEIASRKAGIAAGEPIRLWRFRVDRYGEE
ncbi:MAG: AmmeMemoRadiSam system protein [Acidobacteria bacterium]|nr:AmmeMemoRadiSam system protein [Acidobacteriota bacterium]